jgi:tartrate dehydratase beta subunit/fumarate hydratase class I family protein
MSEGTNTAGSSTTTASAATSVAETDSTSRRGRGHGRGGRSGRGRGNGSRNSRERRSGASHRSVVPTFKGNTDDMKGHVFQSHGENTDKQQFTKTVGMLEEHINKTFMFPQDVASICKSFEKIALVQPKNLTKTEYEDLGKKFMWEIKMKDYMKRLDVMESNTRAIYAIVWGQCSQMMQSKIESLPGYSVGHVGCDCIWLLKEIQGITHQFEGTRNVFISLHDAWSSYYNCKQRSQQSLHEY